MHNHLVPVLLLLALPAIYFAGRLGWLRHAAVRWIGGGALALAVALSLPYQEGVDAATSGRFKLFLAGATTGLLLLRHWRVPWILKPGREMAALMPLAGLSLIVYFNFFAFHPGQRFVHLHEVAHYYLGSKYFGELGYSDLYTAMLRAEVELYGDFKADTVRDLKTNRIVSTRQLVQQSDAVKAAFSDQRWTEFRREVAYFRQAPGSGYSALLLDHGFNPTPVWAALGGTVSGLINLGTGGMLSLALLDLVLLVGLFTAVEETFGKRTLLLAVIYFSIIFGTSFEWTGGALLRYPWLVGVGMGMCFLHQKRYVRAGGLFAAAAMLRVFPVVFVVPLAFKVLTLTWRHRTMPRHYRAFFGGFAATAAVLFLSSCLLPRGFDHWREFGANISLHVRSPSVNAIGLTEVLAYSKDAVERSRGGMTPEAFRRSRSAANKLAGSYSLSSFCRWSPW